MVNKKIERAYWILSLVFIPVVFANLYMVYKNSILFSFSSFYFISILWLGIFLDIPIGIIIMLVFRIKTKFKFWEKNPSITLEKEIRANPMDFIQTAVERLKKCGFSVNNIFDNQTMKGVTFKKYVGKSSYKALDANFEGSLLFTDESQKFITFSITRIDTVIFDNGEEEDTLTLGNYILLNSENLKFERMPGMVTGGWNLSVIGNIIGGLTLFSIVNIPFEFVTACCVGGIGFSASALFTILKNKEQSMGLRICFFSILAGAAPLISLLSFI